MTSRNIQVLHLYLLQVLPILKNNLSTLLKQIYDLFSILPYSRIMRTHVPLTTIRPKRSPSRYSRQIYIKAMQPHKGQRSLHSCDELFPHQLLDIIHIPKLRQKTSKVCWHGIQRKHNMQYPTQATSAPDEAPAKLGAHDLAPSQGP